MKYAQKDLAAAENFYRQACGAYQTYGAAYYGLAMVDRGLGKNIEAARNFELAQRFSANRPPSDDPLAKEMSVLATGIYYHLAEGDQLARNGRVDEAQRLNETLLARDPENFTVLLNLLFLARFRSRLDDRVEGFYTKARQINPGVPLIYDYYGAALLRAGKYDAAAAALRQAIQLRPDYADAHGWLGEVLERQNRLDGAIEQYQRAHELQPSDRSLPMKLWRLLIIHGRSREAIPQLLDALQLEDSFSALRLVLLGEAYGTTGEVEAARRYLEIARNRVRQEGPPGLLVEIDQELARIQIHP